MKRSGPQALQASPSDHINNAVSFPREEPMPMRQPASDLERWFAATYGPQLRQARVDFYERHPEFADDSSSQAAFEK